MITVDENGKIIDFLDKRNKEIKERLANTLDEFLSEKAIMMKSKKSQNLGYRFTKQIYYALAGYGLMSASVFVALDYETINDYWLKYLELTAYYNMYFEIVDNKQLFMAFMGINSRQYSQLEKSSDEDIANLMLMINNSFVGLGFVAGESGNANPLAVKQRLGAKDEGHSVVSASEENLTNALTGGATSPSEIEKKVQMLLNGVK